MTQSKTVLYPSDDVMLRTLMAKLAPCLRISPNFNKPMNKKLAITTLAAPDGTFSTGELAHARQFLAQCGRKP